MLRCNLAVLLSERKLKITKVANDTGISRTTLTALYYNYGQGIQFGTMNALCVYLKVTPEQLFSFIPFDIEVRARFDTAYRFKEKNPTETVEMINVSFIVIDNGNKIGLEMCGDPSVGKNEYGLVNSIDILLNFYDVEDDEQEKEKKTLIKYLSILPQPFLNDIQEKICDDVISYYKDENGALISRLGADFGVEYGEIVEQIDTYLYWPGEIAYKKGR